MFHDHHNAMAINLLRLVRTGEKPLTNTLSMDCRYYLYGLYKSRRIATWIKYLDGRILMIGLRLAIGQRNLTVYVSSDPLHGEYTKDHIYVTEVHAEILKIARILVFTIRFFGLEHWTVFFLIKLRRQVFYRFYGGGQSRKLCRGYEFVKWILEYAEQGKLTVDFHIGQTSVLQQSQASST